MFNRTHLRGWILCGLILALFLACPPVGKAQTAERPVLAFYYAWYDDKSWSADQVPDMPLKPYRSADRATIERHVREAQSAGIDVFVQSWYGPTDNPTERNFKTLLDVAQSAGFQATVDLEVTSPLIHNLDDLKKALIHVINVHAAHPAFFRYGGRPVILFWQNRQYSRETWQALRAEVDPQRQTIWIAEGDDPRWLDVFDGLHLYSITWAVNTNPQYTASKMRQRVDTYNTTNNTRRYWVATTMPGYDDTHIAGRANTFVYPRSPEYYRQTWEAAIASTPDMIIITSFNEWREGTMIEPSVSYGRTYLDLTRELAAAYKAGGTTVMVPTATSLPTSTPAPMATLTPTATLTPSPTPSPTPSSTPSSTPSPTPSSTPTATSTPVPTSTSSSTPTATSTSTPLPRPTVTFTPTSTSTLSPTPTATPDATLAPEATYTLVQTSVSSPTDVPGAGSPNPCMGLPGWVLVLVGGIVLSWRRSYVV